MYLDLLNKIVGSRITKDNNYNANSSRSHLIIKVFIENPLLQKKSVINIVDLAGNERIS